MDSKLSHESSSSDDGYLEVVATRPSGPAPSRDVTTRRRFLGLSAAAAAAATFLGRMVGFTPVAWAQPCYTYNVDFCTEDTAGPCNCLYSQCTYNFLGDYFACFCTAGCGGCSPATFLATCYCTSPFVLEGCCIAC